VSQPEPSNFCLPRCATGAARPPTPTPGGVLVRGNERPSALSLFIFRRCLLAATTFALATACSRAVVRHGPQPSRARGPDCSPRPDRPSPRRAAPCFRGPCIGARGTHHPAKPRVAAARTHLVWTRAVCTLTKGPGDGTANPCKFTCPDPPPLLRVGCSSGRWYF